MDRCAGGGVFSQWAHVCSSGSGGGGAGGGVGVVEAQVEGRKGVTSSKPP